MARLDDRWAAHSRLAGSSHLLNDESAAILSALQPQMPVAESAVYAALASEWGESPAAIEAAVAPTWDQLVGIGLVAEHRATTAL